jgi:hypothetical protein
MMQFIGKRHDNSRCGVVIDIGSGSVMASIVDATKGTHFPVIVWSQREQAPLRNIDSIEQASKAIMTSLVNVALALDTDGRRALRDYNPNLAPESMLVGISAPWTYTITRTISYNQDESFLISKDLLEDLIDTTEEKISSETGISGLAKEMNLSIITSSTLGILANGYRVKNPVGEKALSLNLSHSNVLVQKRIHDAIIEVHEKFFPKATLQSTSFMFLLYSAICEMSPSTYDLALIDITNEATEIGIVRDGVLSFCTHTPFGICSLAREVAEITKKPIVEIFGHLQSSSFTSFVRQLPPKQMEEVEMVFESYTEKLAEIFSQTGDYLAIPLHIFIHTDKRNEKLFEEIINKAFKRTLKVAPVASFVSDELIKRNKSLKQLEADGKLSTDTAMLVASYFFHKQPRHYDTNFL